MPVLVSEPVIPEPGDGLERSHTVWANKAAEEIRVYVLDTVGYGSRGAGKDYRVGF